jgi:hypothetical protein
MFIVHITVLAHVMQMLFPLMVLVILVVVPAKVSHTTTSTASCNTESAGYGMHMLSNKSQLHNCTALFMCVCMTPGGGPIQCVDHHHCVHAACLPLMEVGVLGRNPDVM